ncbi:MAG: cupin domain-containing protein [Actinomycetes bacterium]
MAKTEVTESAVVAALHADLPISSEATTSRTVVSNDAARVVAFAMDAGQELTDHSAAKPAVVQVIEGRLAFTVAGQQQELEVGDVVYLAPGERHAVVALTPCRFVLVLVTAA